MNKKVINIGFEKINHYDLDFKGHPTQPQFSPQPQTPP